MNGYIDREELMKFPIRRNHYDKEHGNKHFIYGIETVLEYAENLPTTENDITVQGWISVKDGLPEPWKRVLIYSRHDFCESAFYIGVPGEWRVTWNHEMLDADSVTHWMPLPEPPKGE